MRILVGCEETGRLRQAFAERGHDVTSCDVKPGAINLFVQKTGKHYQGNIHDIINEGFDLGVFFPPCTHLAKAGSVYWKEKQNDGRQQKAIEFVLSIYNSNIPQLAIENPVGILSTRWRKPDQIIHPYHFGDPYKKETCLWLKNLPLLKHTNVVKPIAHWSCGSYRGGY